MDSIIKSASTVSDGMSMMSKADSFLSIDKSTISTNAILQKLTTRRRYITRTIWVILSIIIILSFIFTSNITSCVILTSCLCLGALINIIITYIHRDFFSIDAYITVPLLYSLAFIKFILIPTDISLNNTSEANSSELTFATLNITWTIVYYLSLFLGTIVLKFQQFYWRQGHPTIKQKVLGALRALLKQLIMILIPGAILLVYLLIKYGFSEMKDIISNVINILNILYSFVFFIILLGFGVVELPLYFLTFTATEEKVKNYLQKIQQLHKETQDARNVFNLDKEILEETCKKVFKQPGHLSFSFSKDIISEITEMKIELNDLFTKDKTIKAISVKPKSEINDDNLALMFAQIKEDYFLACKKFALFMKTFNKLTEELDPCVPNININNKDNDNNSIFNDNNSFNHILSDGTQLTDILNTEPSLVYIKRNKFDKSNSSLIVMPKKYNLPINIFTKTVGVLFGIISTIIVFIQLTLILVKTFNFNLIDKFLILSYDNYYSCYFVLIFYISYLFSCCYYAITQFKIAEFYVIVKHHTNKMGLASNARLSDTILFGIIYNLVAYLGPAYFEDDSKSGNSTIEKYYNNIVKAGYVYTLYYYYFPIILFVIILVYITKKFNLLCFRDKGGEGYLEKFSMEDISEDNLQKIYIIIQKVEKIYYPSQLDQAIEKKRTKTMATIKSIKEKEEKEKDKEEKKRKENLNSINNNSVINNSNQSIITNSSNNSFTNKTTSNTIREIALLQGVMYCSEELSKLNKDKKYMKITKAKIIYADNREQKNRKDLLLSDISEIMMENKFTLKITSQTNNVVLYMTPISIKDSEKLVEISQWKDSIETYKRMSNNV